MLFAPYPPTASSLEFATPYFFSLSAFSFRSRFFNPCFPILQTSTCFPNKPSSPSFATIVEILVYRGVVRGLEWELEGDKAGTMVKVKTRKEGENYHDRHAVLYLGFTLTVLGRQWNTFE